MTSVWALAALWLGFAVVATLLSIWLRISTALSEIVVGTIAQFIFGLAMLGTDEPWVKFLSGIGAIVLTFLAGAELDARVFKLKWKEAAAVGIVAGMAAIVFVPWATQGLFKRYGGRPSEFEPKFLLLCLLGMGALATWATVKPSFPPTLSEWCLPEPSARITPWSDVCGR